MVERRKHKRYPMPRGTFVILRKGSERLNNHAKMSIGEIAMVLYKSKPDFMGQVTDVSFGGVGFESHNTGIPDTGNMELDLLMTEQRLYLHNIPYGTVTLEPTGSGGKKATKFRKNALCFKDLDAELKDRLGELLARHV